MVVKIVNIYRSSGGFRFSFCLLLPSFAPWLSSRPHISLALERASDQFSLIAHDETCHYFSLVRHVGIHNRGIEWMLKLFYLVSARSSNQYISKLIVRPCYIVSPLPFHMQSKQQYV